MKRFLILLGILLALMMGLPSPAHAGTSRYISTSGTDTGNCTSQAFPCQTFTYVLPKMVPGDTLNVGGGTSSVYAENITISLACNQANPCTIQGVGQGPYLNATLKGCVTFNTVSYLTWNAVDVENESGSPQSCVQPVKFKAGDHWTFTNSEVKGDPDIADPTQQLSLVLVVQNTGGASPTDWTISYNCIHDNLDSWDTQIAHDLYIGDINAASNGLVTRNIVFNADDGQNIKLGPGSSGGPTNVTVSYNTAYDASEHNALVSESSQYIVLDHNLFVLVGDHTGSNDMNIREQNPTTSFLNNSYDYTGFYAAPDGLFSCVDNVGSQCSGSNLMTDDGHNFSLGDPTFDGTTCNTFHPGDSDYAGVGRYGS